MLKLNLSVFGKSPKILCLGAHPDDIEIGCGGTLLSLSEQISDAQFWWVILSGNKERQKEALRSANSFVPKSNIVIKNFRESYFPFIGAEIKDYFEQLKKNLSPDIIFTHFRQDLHQDHSVISALTWNTFRNHLIFEYETPKYEGDLVTPNFYVNLTEKMVETKINLILNNFSSQKQKHWFNEETFRSILRLRGIECASSGYAEGFHARKIIIGDY